MKLLKLGASATACVRYLILLLLLLSLSGCLDPCRNEVLEELPSPGEEYKAVVFQRDCGATTGYSTQVSILPEDAGRPRGKGNVFIVDTDHGAAPAGPGGGPKVSTQWLSDEELLISYHPQARVFRQETSYGDDSIVSIEYEKVEDPAS